MKNRFFIGGILVLVLVFGMTVIGCTTTHYGVDISNVTNIKEVYIRNAEATQWSKNLAGILNDIDISGFSERVDIKVVDTNGLVYSKQNVPFGDAAFVQTSKTNYMGMGTSVLGSLLGLAILIPVIATRGGGN